MDSAKVRHRLYVVSAMKFRSKWENHVRKVFQDLLIYIRWLSWQENTMVSIITKESAMKDLMAKHNLNETEALNRFSLLALNLNEFLYLD